MTTSVFIFGTLLDVDILEIVCQQPIDKLPRKPATIPGFEPRYVVGQKFPVLVLAPKSATVGAVVDFDDILLQRLNACEQDNFELCDVTVKLDTGADYQCQYYANIGFETISERRWSLEEFQRLHKRDFLRQLHISPRL